MKGFKLTDDGDISFADGHIEMVDGAELEKQTVKTVLGTNKGESPFDPDEGIDFRQILGKGVTADMAKTQIQNGIRQVIQNANIEEFSYITDSRKAVIGFTFRNTDNNTVTELESSWEI